MGCRSTFTKTSWSFPKMGKARTLCFARPCLIALVIGLVTSIASAHPANIPVVRSKVQANGQFDLEITFDILAFVLDQTPQIVLDAPMNALLDGAASDLQERLTQAQKRFLEGFLIGKSSSDAVLDTINFPTAADIHETISGGQIPRLPVMMTARIHGHLKPGVSTICLHFPEVMGTVVVTTEFPYQEPISESVDPGETSSTLSIPTQKQVDTLAASMRPRLTEVTHPQPQVSETEAKRAIQHQYDAWSRAYMRHDLPTMLGILSTGYSLKTAQGKVINYPEYEVMLRLRKQKHSDTTLYKTEILRMTLKAGVAAIFSRETTTDPGLNQKTGKAEPVSYQHDYIDVWVLSKGKWLLKSTVTQREQVVNLTKSTN